MKKYNATAYDRKQAKELLAQGYKYLARDDDGMLIAHRIKPKKTEIGHNDRSLFKTEIWLSNSARAEVRENYFKFVKWEDDEPTLIADIVRGGRK